MVYSMDYNVNVGKTMYVMLIDIDGDFMYVYDTYVLQNLNEKIKAFIIIFLFYFCCYSKH